jgi:hypothetical protein
VDEEKRVKRVWKNIIYCTKKQYSGNEGLKEDGNITVLLWLIFSVY